MAILQEIVVPLLAVNDTSLTVVEINFNSGDKVKKGDAVMVFETSKTTYDVEAETDGFIQYHCVLDEDYEVNQVVARIFSEEKEAQAPAGPATGPEPAATQTRQTDASGTRISPATDSTVTTGLGHDPALNGTVSNGLSFISPVQSSTWSGDTLFSQEAIRLITSGNLDKALFAGKDLVSAADVLAITSPSSKKAEGDNLGSRTDGPKAVKEKAILPVDETKVIIEKLTLAKKREIAYLGDVQSTGLTSTINTYVETGGIFTHINRSLKYLKDSLLPVILYESSRLLTAYPLLNAYFTGDAIALYKEINPGFAIDIDKGLKVLRIAGADARAIDAIEEEIMRLSGAYLDDALAVEDLSDITFTITDLSSEGVAFFRPLVNKMNSSILGVSAIDDKLQRCMLSLTFDHRVTEGKLAARFLKELKDRLESYRPADDLVAVKDLVCFKCYKTLQEDLSGAGFARCVTPQGKDGYICQSCLKGF